VQPKNRENDPSSKSEVVRCCLIPFSKIIFLIITARNAYTRAFPRVAPAKERRILKSFFFEAREVIIHVSWLSMMAVHFSAGIFNKTGDPVTKPDQ